MNVASSRRQYWQSERGQSTLLGIVLLLGMVAAGSLGILLVAGDAINSAEQQSEQERIEQAFVSLSNSITSSTSSGDVSQSMELHAGERGAIAHHDSATYEIWTQNYNGTENNTIAEGSIGTIEYESEDGTKVAYEGGGVFRETGEQTQVLSAPPLDYEHETSTLSFPVVTLTEEQTIRSGDVQIKQTNVEPEPTNYIQNDHVFVEIESEYCRGWEEYFTTQAGDTTLQESCFDGENEDGVVKVRLGYDDLDNAFSAGVSLPSDDNLNDDNNVFTDVDTGTQYQPLDGTVTQLVSDFENGSAQHIQDVDEKTTGEYYADEIDDMDVEFNLSDGDATLAVDGDIRVLDSEISVTDCGEDGNNQLRIYSTGNLAMGGDSIIQPDCDSGDVETIQIYGTSMMGIDFQGNPTFKGLIYAASDIDRTDDDFDGWPMDQDGSRDNDYQVNFQGSNEFDGAIVANSIYVPNNMPHGINESGLEDSNIELIPEGYEPAPPLTYLNLAEHEIEIKN
ncbi:DUF7289 family protein [Natronolimnohabitans innermongolicus]|uniref:DUF7305 domain-containing protein n=1 Tax=Natronolimnohabitans innermongolicus JCM 12255 TaxID=1227499 RepID=L9X803_9EURY|nr:hypothetical protein [Natronolimnohabitans innermongolicus]ELY57531.1 hypothetical protein C493_08596 [Natronolimnohabitans innermongolicus JCM 12255]